MTTGEIARLRALCNAATDGPWHVRWLDDDKHMNAVAISTEPDTGLHEALGDDHFPDGRLVAATLIQGWIPVSHDSGRWDEDSAFIAEARTALPAALDEIERQRLEYQEVCEAFGLCDYAEGQGPVYPTAEQLCRHAANERTRLALHQSDRDPRPRDSWYEDDGPVLWWKFPITEPPYCGSPLDDDFPDYVTHWTPVPMPHEVRE